MLWWYVAVCLCLLVEWVMMKTALGIEYTNAIGTAIKAVGDVAIILLPYWLLSPRWRWTAVLPVWLFAIWCVGNLVYFRFWNDMIPPAAVSMGGNVDGNLMQYALALLRGSDLLFLLVPMVAQVLLKVLRPACSAKLDLRYRIMTVALSLIVGAAGQFSYFKTTHSWRNALNPGNAAFGLADHFIGGYTGQHQLYTYNGPVYYGVRFVVDVFGVLAGSVDLSEAQRNEISGFLDEYGREDTVADVSRTDSVNVVYIIVESLNADMLGKKVGGRPVMPVLDSLASAEGTVLFDNVVSQTKASSSSDGHLLLMTGLLPPEKVSYSITYGGTNRFPSLADVFPNHQKYLLLADDGVCWNEGNTLRNFGLGEPLAIKDRPDFDISVLGRDGAMFRQAISMLRTVRQPFFMTLMTISMHIPFKEEAWPVPSCIEDAPGLSRMEKDYANMCRMTDRYIGEFIAALPENTLIFITSDHHQSITADDSASARGMMMAVNTGRTQRISRTVGQVNLFPATLDIIGRSGSYGGLAPSAFDERVDGTMGSYGNVYGSPGQGALDTLGHAYEISDLIIRGNYFEGL